MIDKITLEAINAEMDRQDKKWGSNRSHPPMLWLAILGEEYGEVCKAVLETNPQEYRQELVQVIAVCIQALQSSLTANNFGMDSHYSIASLKAENAELHNRIAVLEMEKRQLEEWKQKSDAVILRQFAEDLRAFDAMNSGNLTNNTQNP